MSKQYSVKPHKSRSIIAGPARRISNNPQNPQFPFPEPKRPYTMYESFRQQRIVDVYISDEITDPLEYTDLIQTIRHTGPEDILHVHINCPGGRLDTGIQLINALRASQAHVITELQGVGHSMAALLFLCGADLVVHENTQLMFHTYSGGIIGKGSDMRGQNEATEEWFRLMAYDICYPFMSKKEIARMLKGEDFWFQHSTITPRIERMVAILTQQAEEAQREHDEKTRNNFDQIIADALQEKAEEAESEEEYDRYMAALQYLRTTTEAEAPDVGIPYVEGLEDDDDEQKEEEDDLPPLGCGPEQSEVQELVVEQLQVPELEVVPAKQPKAPRKPRKKKAKE